MSNMERKYVDISVVADENCDHEIDDETAGESCDGDIMSQYREAAFYIQCKKCGGAGICVDDTGDFWLDDDGSFI